MDQEYLEKNIQVAIPTYNRPKYLGILLESIPSSINVVVSDNGSYTPSSFRNQYKNAKFLDHANVIGIFSNWNSAAKGTDSEWLIIPSDDDVFLPQAFETVERYLKKYSDIDILIFGHKIINGHDEFSEGWIPKAEKVLNPPDGYEDFKYNVFARMPSVVFRRSKVNEQGWFNEKFELTAGDSHLIQKMLLTSTVAFIPEIISAYRVWDGALTSQKIATKLWLDEIDFWQNDIEKTIDNLDESNFGGFKNIKDEVYARNMLVGLKNIKGTGILNKTNFILSNRFPWNARFKTKMAILKSVFI